ncbi:MAG: restriction endonuclease subunit S [Azonexus sp.]|jgi:type I restriction enzyme S subunit|nr:restriction endonuclease subunit S [Azonexus sp.]
MKYAAYKEYKSSGSNWLDAVPSHWNVKSLKLIVKMPITDGPHETPEFIPDGVPFASVEAVWDGKVHLSSVRGYISEDDHRRYSKKYHPEPDDIFIVKSGSTTGKIAIVDFDDDFNVWSPLAAVRCDASQACPEFVFYALSSSYFQRLVQVSWSFGTQPNIGMGVLGNLPAVLPPLLEQQAIARFLDAKTAQIDALVAQKRQLIAKLKEKRSALIARTVTRGLPPEAAKAAGLEPNPEMKDSGVDWLGAVPARWKVLPLRRLIKFVKTGNTPSGAEDHHFEESGFNWYSPSDFSEDIYLGLAHRALSAEGKTEIRVFPENTVMLVGIGATIGKVGLALGECSCNQQINAIGCSFKLDPVFATYYLKILRDFIVKCGKFTTLPIINQDETKNLVFTVPSLSEQSAIAAYLDRETVEIDQLMVQVDEAISRLTEYRQALITSAVTGKIDVRAVANREMEMA